MNISIGSLPCSQSNRSVAAMSCLVHGAEVSADSNIHVSPFLGPRHDVAATCASHSKFRSSSAQPSHPGTVVWPRRPVPAVAAARQLGILVLSDVLHGCHSKPEAMSSHSSSYQAAISSLALLLLKHGKDALHSLAKLSASKFLKWHGSAVLPRSLAARHAARPSRPASPAPGVSEAWETQPKLRASCWRTRTCTNASAFPSTVPEDPKPAASPSRSPGAS